MPPGALASPYYYTHLHSIHSILWDTHTVAATVWYHTCNSRGRSRDLVRVSTSGAQSTPLRLHQQEQQYVCVPTADTWYVHKRSPNTQVNKHRFPGGQTNGQSQTNKQTDSATTEIRGPPHPLSRTRGYFQVDKQTDSHRQTNIVLGGQYRGL